MEAKQPKLLNSHEHAPLLGRPTSHPRGPVFEAGPGWGFRIRRWLGKKFLGTILPSIVIIILAIGFFIVYKNHTAIKDKTPEAKTISMTVMATDSKTLLARKALAEYLIKFPGDILTNGQKVFIEEIMRKKIDGTLAVGALIEFGIEDIKTAIDQSLQL